MILEQTMKNNKTATKNLLDFEIIIQSDMKINAKNNLKFFVEINYNLTSKKLKSLTNIQNPSINATKIPNSPIPKCDQ